MDYRRNADDTLRRLEREYSQSPSKDLLTRIDVARHRAGMIPHPDTRVVLAEDLYTEDAFQSFRLLNEMHPYLEDAFTASHEVRIMPDVFNDEQLLPQIDHWLEIRDRAQNEGMYAIRGDKPTAEWLRFLKEQKVKLLGKKSKLKAGPGDIALAPRMEDPAVVERVAVASRYREMADEHCRNFLRELSQLGVLNAYNFLNSFVDREEELAELLLRIRERLQRSDLIFEEILLATRDEDPNPEYVEDVGKDRWRYYFQGLIG